MSRYTLHIIGSNRRHRLTGAASFARVLREGERFEARYVRLMATPATGTVGRVGFVIGKRELKLAVDRNYARRLMREVVRSRRPAIERFDIVLRLRGRCERPDLAKLGSEAAAVLDALLKSRAR